MYSLERKKAPKELNVTVKLCAERLYLLRRLAPLKRNLFHDLKIRKVLPGQETTQISYVRKLKKFLAPRKHTNADAKVIPRGRSPPKLEPTLTGSTMC